MFNNYSFSSIKNTGDIFLTDCNRRTRKEEGNNGRAVRQEMAYQEVDASDVDAVLRHRPRLQRRCNGHKFVDRRNRLRNTYIDNELSLTHVFTCRWFNCIIPNFRIIANVRSDK